MKPIKTNLEPWKTNQQLWKKIWKLTRSCTGWLRMITLVTVDRSQPLFYFVPHSQAGSTRLLETPRRKWWFFVTNRHLIIIYISSKKLSPMPWLFHYSAFISPNLAMFACFWAFSVTFLVVTAINMLALGISRTRIFQGHIPSWSKAVWAIAMLQLWTQAHQKWVILGSKTGHNGRVSLGQGFIVETLYHLKSHQY